jgi:hypothetical protein
METAPDASAAQAAVAPPAESIVVWPASPPAAAPSAAEPPRADERVERPRTKPARRRRAPNHSNANRVAGSAAGRARLEGAETAVKRVYWHKKNGARYAHYFDGKAHWYGFYDGPRFYWARYAADRWWWYDAVVSRWLYWNDGYWWWQDPAASGSVYLDIDDSFYAYADTASAAAVSAADASADAAPADARPPAAAPADAPAALDASTAAARGVPDNRASASADGTRMVQIYGDRREAFLYDETGGAEPRFLAYLAAGVTRVRFSQPPPGQPFDIMVMLNDGTFALFDASGKPELQPTSAGAPPADDAAPSDIPPPPTSAPQDPAQ